jgi:hypothetical protein
MSAVAVDLRAGDVFLERGDVLVLKYAQFPHGLDKAAIVALEKSGTRIELPPPWKCRFAESPSAIKASRLLFVGVPPLYEFAYKEIRAFAKQALKSLAEQAPDTKSVLLTIHGANFGLDEVEAFSSEIAGLVDAIGDGDCPGSLEKITIMERGEKRAERLKSVLPKLLPDLRIHRTALPGEPHKPNSSERLQQAGEGSARKARVFVAMPFQEEMDDVYHYGIQNAVNAAGLLCERADLSPFTGDVMEWVKSRIRSASLVVADLTDANPNVYLELGYAWGTGTPTVLLAKSTDHLKFDVRGQRCLVYRKIRELEDKLAAELRALRPED